MALGLNTHSLTPMPVFRDDLVPGRSPHNGWSLKGLELALSAQQKPFADVHEQFVMAWKHADFDLKTSCLI